MSQTQDIVAKLWNLCNVLRDDGTSYLSYITELTFLLFLKMAKETGREGVIPEGYRWDDLKSRNGVDRLSYYKSLLLHLDTMGRGRVQAIFAEAKTSLSEPKNLDILVAAFDQLDWYDGRKEGFGDLYEGLLEKCSTESKSGAGQYFTPRPLIESMVACTQPSAGERIQDPACGTGGFLIAADRYLRARTDNYYNLDSQGQRFQAEQALCGVEKVPVTHRLALMNALLHDIEGPIILGDTLSPEGQNLEKADVILTNPPFGNKKGGGKPNRDDFTFPTSNKQLAFLQHIYRGLKPGGRAAVVLPDNVLFEEGQGTRIREDLLNKCRLHTILRLPTGIFYAQGVKTNVLFFSRGETDKEQTKATWIWDMRSNAPAFGKRTPLTRAHFKDFEKAYGEDPQGWSERKDLGEEGRFRRFSIEEIQQRNWNLDITWLRDENSEKPEDLPEPDEIAAEIIGHLRSALEEMEALTAILEGEE